MFYWVLLGFYLVFYRFYRVFTGFALVLLGFVRYHIDLRNSPSILFLIEFSFKKKKIIQFFFSSLGTGRPNGVATPTTTATPPGGGC